MKTRVAEMIDKEIVIALAKEAGFEMWVDDLHKLCNLAAAHAQKDAEPVAWMDMVTVNLVREGINKHKARELANHFYTHPAHDDTALLRMALGQLECNTENMSKGMSKSIQKLCARENTEAITALRERLGEVK